MPTRILRNLQRLELELLVGFMYCMNVNSGRYQKFREANKLVLLSFHSMLIASPFAPSYVTFTCEIQAFLFNLIAQCQLEVHMLCIKSSIAVWPLLHLNT